VTENVANVEKGCWQQKKCNSHIIHYYFQFCDLAAEIGPEEGRIRWTTLLLQNLDI